MISSLCSSVIHNNNYYCRTHSIDTITIHCACANTSADAIATYLSSTKWSANYTIGCDGSICCNVPEQFQSICSSNLANDDRAITIEVASASKFPYEVSDKAFDALIDLLVDVCFRYNIFLKWSYLKSDRINHFDGCNMTVHRDYANKSCPGQALYDSMDDIAYLVNERIDKLKRFHSVSDVPEGFYRDFVQLMIDHGIIKGHDNDLDLDLDMIRTLIFCSRIISFGGFKNEN